MGPIINPWNGKVVLDGEDSNLRDMILFVENELEKFQLFWNIMDDFDSNVWVLEPQTKSLFDCSPNRYQHCSMHVKINLQIQKVYVNSISWEKPIVEPLRSKLHTNIEAWSDSYTPRKSTAFARHESRRASADLNFHRVWCAIHIEGRKCICWEKEHTCWSRERCVRSPSRFHL